MAPVNREEFEKKLESLREDKKSRLKWDRNHIEKVKNILRSSIKAKSFYHYSNHYELLQIGNECHLILKRKNDTDSFIYLIPIEDYYQKLSEAHIESGHGGRDRMLYYMKNKWKITRSACEIFINCCETCSRKKSAIRKGVVVKPIISHGFNARGQVDLIDFQTCKDGEYAWLMNYQDHATKFVQLRPLKSKHAANVVEELSKIFYTFGAPLILQMDNGKEFTATKMKQLVSKWPHCKIIHGRPRHPQTQGSVEW